MDGYESWTGAYIVDRIVRDGFAAAQALVTSVAHGWDCIGGTPLDEMDDFLGGDVITNDVSSEILDRHYAVYVIDSDGSRLEVYVNTEERWREPAVFADGAVTLPSWYPQLGDRSFTKRRRPEAVTRELQAQCLELGLAWGPVCEALRRWIAAQLDRSNGCAWMYLGGSSDEHVRCLIDDTFVYASVDSTDYIFSSADGHMRRFDIDNMELAEQKFSELGLSASRAVPVMTKWLTLAAKHGADDSLLRAEWWPHPKRWNIERADGIGRAPAYLPSPGCFPTLLCWLF
jgi:hypothetical protein